MMLPLILGNNQYTKVVSYQKTYLNNSLLLLFLQFDVASTSVNGSILSGFQNPVRHLRWSAFRKYFTAKSR